MALIKNIQAKELVGSAVVMNLGDVRLEAEHILAEARREAAEVIDQAKAEARALIEGAAEQGHAEGVERGEAEGRASGLAAGTAEGHDAAESAHGARLAAIADGWHSSLEALLTGREQLREEARRDLLRLSIAIAERVLGRLPEHDPNLVAAQVEAAVEMLAGATRLRIRINPEDRPIVETHFEKATRSIGAASEMDVVLETDPAIIRGGCVVSAGDGEVDARLDSQMSRIVSGLFPELLESPEAERPSSPTATPAPTAPATEVAASAAESPGSEAGSSDRTSWDDIAPSADPSGPIEESSGEDQPQ
ncbi:MAG: hypothetical protein GY895_22525 [Phycisphaera sp.]|nr:hypothetical protein [Phycisphaera sp.]